MQPISLEVGSAPIAEQARKILEAFARQKRRPTAIV